uniref:Endonuclease III n=1 Tax=Chlorobium chlorochromatii (strain CaD3) TaxID=340177 RepID=Q3ATI6_CHLCH
MNPQEKIIALHDLLSKQFPNPKSELEYLSPFQLLIATILAAQATDKQVNVITRELFKRAPDAITMSRMELEEITGYVRTINYFNNKAKNILEVSRRLVEHFGGEVPQEREALESLPGVGRKTANVVLANAFGMPVMAVDTHVHRVSNRIGLVSTKKVEATEEALMAIIPEAWVADFHHYLLLHGRYTCKAKKPACPTCTVAHICDFAE